MAELRLVATISPKVYEEIITETDDNYVLLKNIFDFAVKLQHILILFFPSELITFMNKSKTLKILYDNYNHGLFPNVFFQTCSLCDISLVDFAENVIPQNAVHFLLAKIMMKGKFPFIFDKNTYSIRKVKCNNNTCNSLCIEEHELTIARIDKNTLQELKNNSILNIQKWCVKEGHFTIDDIKQIAILYAFYYGATKEDFDAFSKVIILDQFLNDITQLSFRDFISVAYTIFRGSVFPPSNSVNSNPKSVDWHQHKGIKDGNDILYRIDVIEPEKGQNHSSGVKRIFKIIKNGKTYILRYDYKHGDNLTKSSFKERFKLCK